MVFSSFFLHWLKSRFSSFNAAFQVYRERAPTNFQSLLPAIRPLCASAQPLERATQLNGLTPMRLALHQLGKVPKNDDTQHKTGNLRISPSFVIIIVRTAHSPTTWSMSELLDTLRWALSGTVFDWTRRVSLPPLLYTHTHTHTHDIKQKCLKVHY